MVLELQYSFQTREKRMIVGCIIQISHICHFWAMSHSGACSWEQFTTYKIAKESTFLLFNDINMLAKMLQFCQPTREQWWSKEDQSVSDVSGAGDCSVCCLGDPMEGELLVWHRSVNKFKGMCQDRNVGMDIMKGMRISDLLKSSCLLTCQPVWPHTLGFIY